jgi:predicted nucleic acid-binding protein
VIAADTSTVIAYLGGGSGKDVDALDLALAESRVCIPPVVLTELLSDPKLPLPVARLIEEVPVLEILDGYWRRAGLLRARVLAARRRGRLADTLIAQSCLDHDVMLLTRDQDFGYVARIAGLKLAVEGT